MGHGRIFLSVDWGGPNFFSSICGMGGLLSGLLPQVSQPKRNYKAEPWGKVKGQPKLWLKIGAYGQGRPNMLSHHPAAERPYLRTLLRLMVTIYIFFSRGKAESYIVGLDLPNLRASGPGV